MVSRREKVSRYVPVSTSLARLGTLAGARRSAPMLMMHHPCCEPVSEFVILSTDMLFS